MSNAYIFYGKAGSGKGTQAQLLKTHLESMGRKVLYIETGNLFREFSTKSESFAAKRTAEVINSGQLMPPFFPIFLWSRVLIEQYDGTQDLILDGVTRRIEEALVLESALDFFQVDKKIILNIHIKDETAFARLAIREGNRSDDSDAQKIEKRLHWYRDNVVPVLDYFKTRPEFKFHEIDGEPDVETIQKNILEILDKI